MLSLDSVPPEVGECIASYLNPTSIPSLRLITRTFTHSWNFCTSFHFCFSQIRRLHHHVQRVDLENAHPGLIAAHMKFYGLGKYLPAMNVCSSTRCLLSGNGEEFCRKHGRWRVAFQMLIEHGGPDRGSLNAREAVDILTSLNLLHMVPSAVETIKRNLAMHPALAKVVDLQLSNAIKRKHSEACRCLCEARFSIESNLESFKITISRLLNVAAESGNTQLFQDILGLEKARLGGLECEPATHIIKFTNSIDVLQSILLNPRMQIDIKTFRNAALRCNAVDILIKLAETFPMDASEIVTEIFRLDVEHTADIMVNPGVPTAWRDEFVELVLREYLPPDGCPTFLPRRQHIRAIAVLTREKLYDPRKHRQNVLQLALKFGTFEDICNILSNPSTDPSTNNQFALRWAFEECDLGLSEVLMADERVDLMVVADREFLAWVGSRNLAFLVAVLGNSRLRRDLRISENRHRVVDGERMDVDGNKYLDRLLWIRYELFGDEMTLLDFQNLLVCAGVLGGRGLGRELTLFLETHHHYLRQLMDITRSENEVLANVLTFAVAHGLDDLAEFLLGHENLGHWARPDHLILAIEKKSMNAVKAILSVAPMTSACVNAAICKARDVGDDEIVNFLILKSSTMADLALQEQGAAVRAGSSCVSQMIPGLSCDVTMSYWPLFPQ